MERKRRSDRAKLYEDPVFLDLLEQVATNTRSARLAQNLTQEKAAELCDMSLSHYQEVEGSQANLTMISLAKLTKGLSIAAGDLFLPVKKKLARRPRKKARYR